MEPFELFGKNDQELTPVTYSPAAIKVLHYEVEANAPCFRIHWHDRMEFIRVHEGDVYLTYGTSTAHLHPGDMMIFPPKIPHKGYTGNNPVKYDVLMFDIRSFYNDSELCQALLPAVFDGRAKFQPVTSDMETIRCFDDICLHWNDTTLSLTSKLYWFLHLLYENCVTELQDKLHYDHAVAEMIAYLEEHFSQELSTASLCAHFGYTATHFGRKFKEATGLTPMTYLKIFRMEQAYKLLKQGKRNISEIAAYCGYSDANYFTRCFKSHFGFPPSQLK